jgi:hypothetical protein
MVFTSLLTEILERSETATDFLYLVECRKRRLRIDALAMHQLDLTYDAFGIEVSFKESFCPFIMHEIYLDRIAEVALAKVLDKPGLACAMSTTEKKGLPVRIVFPFDKLRFNLPPHECPSLQDDNLCSSMSTAPLSRATHGCIYLGDADRRRPVLRRRSCLNGILAGAIQRWPGKRMPGSL